MYYLRTILKYFILGKNKNFFLYQLKPLQNFLYHWYNFPWLWDVHGEPAAEETESLGVARITEVTRNRAWLAVWKFPSKSTLCSNEDTLPDPTAESWE